MTAVPRTQAAGVRKATRHEVTGGLAPDRADRYEDLIFAPVVKLGANGQRQRRIRSALGRGIKGRGAETPALLGP
jgi:hypothetical protein